MTQQDVHGDRQGLPKIWVGTFLVRSIHPRGKIKLILTVKMETRHGPFGREFSAFVIIAELGWPEVTRPKIVSNFLHFFFKNEPSETVTTARIVPKICQGQPPTFGSQCSRSHPNWFTFDGVIAIMCKDRFCPVKYLQYRLFQPIIIYVTAPTEIGQFEGSCLSSNQSDCH